MPGVSPENMVKAATYSAEGCRQSAGGVKGVRQTGQERRTEGERRDRVMVSQGKLVHEASW